MTYDLDRLKTANRIEDVAIALGLEPKREGPRWLARCPAHSDQGRPNLSIDPAKQRAACYRCGFRADVIDLVATVKGQTKAEAMAWLAQRAGLSPALGYGAKGMAKRSHPKRPAQVPAVAPDLGYASQPAVAQPHPKPADPAADGQVEVYRALLALAKPVAATEGEAYLAGRGISAKTQAAQKIAWLADWATADRELKKRFGPDRLKAAGLLTAKGALHFEHHRLLFPLFLGEDPVFIQGRTLKPKSEDGHDRRFDNASGPVPCLYNVNAIAAAKDLTKPVFVCEGIPDTLTLIEDGRFAVGMVGAHGFKREWAKAFAGLDVYLALDPDAAGGSGAKAVAKLFVAAGLAAPKVLKMPAGQDVNDFFTGRATKKT